MTIDRLTESQRKIIYGCLAAIAGGPFLDEAEFQTRMGIDRETLKSVIRRWPNVDDADDASDAALAINSSLNEICNGLWLSKADWGPWLAASRDEIEQTFAAWRSARSRA